MPQRPRSEIRNDRFYPNRFFRKSRSRSRKGDGRIDETERYVAIRVGIKNRHGVYLLERGNSTVIGGMKRLCEEQKKLQASTMKIEKMVEEMQHGMEQTVSSKMPILRNLSVSLKLKRLVVLCFCRLQFIKYMLRL